MKKTMIRILLEANDNFVSGEFISQQLGITRAAIWKRMTKLKEEGFEIEAITKKGYRLISYPNILTKELIEIGMKTEFIGHDIEVLEAVDSTNDYAKKKASSSKDGSIVISKEQVKGKGRRGRDFHSSKDDGIYLSMILKPAIEPSKAPFITSIAGAALIKALDNFDVKGKVKWPNDILINDKKIAGILTEMSADIELIEYIILGVGINVDTMNFPDEIKAIASSLKLEGFNINKIDLIWSFAYEFEKLYNCYLEGKTKEVIDILNNNSSVIGRQINVHYLDKIETALAIGINEQGALIIKTKDNQIKELNSGEISIR